MKRKLKAEDFAVGDVVGHLCSDCDKHVGAIVEVVTTKPNNSIMRDTIGGIVEFSGEPNEWEDGDRMSWSLCNLTPLYSPLVLAKRYCGYEESGDK